jgi:hypothetical protein
LILTGAPPTNVLICSAMVLSVSPNFGSGAPCAHRVWPHPAANTITNHNRVFLDIAEDSFEKPAVVD